MKESGRWIAPNEELMQAVEAEVDKCRQVLIAVRGNSMNPLWIDRRDKVLLGAFREKDCKVGTVVLARLDTGNYVLHRIVGIDNERVTVMGDGNCYATEQVKFHQIIARVVGFVRNGKKSRCSGWKWEVYSRIWMGMRPARRWILAVWRRFN